VVVVVSRGRKSMAEEPAEVAVECEAVGLCWKQAELWC
jgi:hypothetical protein